MASQCSFCGTPADAAPLFSGRVAVPSLGQPAFICLDCAGRVRERPEAAIREPVECSFCAKPGALAERAEAITICDDCIEVCLEVSAPFIIKP